MVASSRPSGWLAYVRFDAADDALGSGAVENKRAGWFRCVAPPWSPLGNSFVQPW
jgi:hypothetical protein